MEFTERFYKVLINKAVLLTLKIVEYMEVGEEATQVTVVSM